MAALPAQDADATRLGRHAVHAGRPGAGGGQRGGGGAGGGVLGWGGVLTVAGLAVAAAHPARPVQHTQVVPHVVHAARAALQQPGAQRLHHRRLQVHRPLGPPQREVEALHGLHQALVHGGILGRLLVGVLRALHRHPEGVKVFAHALHQFVRLEVLLTRREAPDVGHVGDGGRKGVHAVLPVEVTAAQSLLRQRLQEGRQLEGRTHLLHHLRPQQQQLQEKQGQRAEVWP